MPWRNGGGTTWEVVATPGAAEPGFSWRVSFAAVTESGPFSTFPHVDRVLTLLDGVDLRLTVDETVHELTPHEPFEFAGESFTSAAVTGPTLDLNVMVDRRKFVLDAVVHRLAEHDTVRRIAGGGTLIVTVLSGRATLTGETVGSEPVTLGERDVAVSEHGSPADLRGSAVVQVNRLTPAASRAARG